MEEKNNNNSKPEKEKNSGFLKGVAAGMLSAVLMIVVLAGCSGISSLIGPGSDKSNRIEQGTGEDTAQKNASASTGSKTDNQVEETTSKATYGKYKPKSEQLTDEVIEKIDTLMQVIDYYYLYDYDKDAMVDAIYKAVMGSLGDPYSVYYTGDEFKAFMESSSGSYCGIGVVVQQNMQTGLVTAVRPYEDCPGYEAGIRPGDLILAVDGTEITGMDLNTAVALIKGEEGTSVTITLQRDEEVFDVEVTRRQIDVKTVNYRMMDDNIGYIQIEEFDEVTSDQFSQALDSLIEQGMEALVIDIRNNPGGILDTVVAMLDELLPEGTIVSVKDRNGTAQEYTSDADTKLTVPLTVLINGNSASASEIFAGAIKDYGVGTLVGTTTYGKGIVQTAFSLSDGTGVKITIEDYYLPSGKSIHKVGVDPDVEIDLPDELKTYVTIPEDEDVQLQKAIEILKEQLQK